MINYNLNIRNKNKTTRKKGFFSLLNQLICIKPKNLNDFLKLIQDSKLNNVIDRDICDILERFISITSQRVHSIMIPRSQTITLKYNQTLEECIDIINQSKYSNFPVIGKNKDCIEGILVVKDLIKSKFINSNAFNIREILHKVMVIPENKLISRFLKEFSSYHYQNQMTIVIDEFDNFSGFITMKDIFKLIINKNNGFCEKNINFCKSGNFNTWIVHALTKTEDINNMLGTNFINKEANTIGGLLMRAFGYLPRYGEKININGYQFKVTMADNRHIIQIRIKKIK